MVALPPEELSSELFALRKGLQDTKNAILSDTRRLFSEKDFAVIESLVEVEGWEKFSELELDQHTLFLVAEAKSKSQALEFLLEEEDAREAAKQAIAVYENSVEWGRSFFEAERASVAHAKTGDAIRERAAASGRFLTIGEIKEVAARAAKAQLVPSAQPEPGSLLDPNTVLETVSKLRIAEAKKQLSEGLLLTPQMSSVISETLPATRRGSPLLLIGETGGAKTALAEHLAKQLGGGDYEFVSGYSDISSTQVIGTHELRAVDGATVSSFIPGPLLRALSAGLPLILDELNAMPADFLKRLNRILQLKPGDVLGVQENAGERYTVAPGFVIIATANEQAPGRYRGIHSLSAELLNRFGANTFRITYPDSTNQFDDFPSENGLLAVATLSNDAGELPPQVSNQEIELISRFAFITQQIFSGKFGAGFDNFVDTAHQIDGKPGLEETVFAPRTMVTLLQNVVASGGSLSIERALNRFVDSVMNKDDQRVLKSVLSSLVA